MAFEWVAGLFQSDNQQTRGLSGDQAHSVALDDSNPYYNYRLRRHKAEGDLIADAGLLWYTSPYVKRRSGLGTHVGADVGEGTANYTDVLLILSKEDYLRASADWQQNASRTLQQEFDNFCRRENFNRLHAHRPLGVRILEDGSTAMGGQSLQLGRGEFVTGLLPNLYTGPVRGSFPVIGVHLNLPGVWQGYQEIGRLYNDQILFTLGNHWLDNFGHPSLQQGALYRLRQYPDGSFVHIVNPDLQDQYQVTSTDQGGASVLTLATRGGQPLAYMVLAVIEAPSARPSRSTAPSSVPLSATPMGPTPQTAPTRSQGAARPDIQMPKTPPTAKEPARQAPTPAPNRAQPGPSAKSPNAIPSIAPPMMLEDFVSSTGEKLGLGGKTIIPDAPSERIFTLQERGALLQKVHFSAFMLGYDVYMGSRGELGTHVEDAAATFQVRKRTVSIVAHVDGVTIGGRPVAAGVEVPIEGDVKIEVAGQKLEYRDLRGLQVDGWPYVGEIRRPASSTYMIWGEDYQIGRSRECRVVLPDEPRNDNIHWKPSVGDGATIRARTGEIPKSRFYTDSIMVASEHCSVDLRNEMPRFVCTARHCYVYVRRGGEMLPLYPATSPQQPKDFELTPGDEVLIGNCLFQIGFTPPSGNVATTAPAPKVELGGDPTRPNDRANRLAGAIARPDLTGLDKASVPPPPVREPLSPPPPALLDDDEVPPPEDAPDLTTPPPAPPPRGAVGLDSIVFDAVDPALAPLALGADGPIDIGDDDEPTVPGIVLPPDAFDTPDQAPTAEGGAGAPWHTDGRALPTPNIDADISVDAEPRPEQDKGGWDREEWSEEDSLPQPMEPIDVDLLDAAGRTASVPTPFPDLAVSPESAAHVDTPAPQQRSDDQVPADPRPPEAAGARTVHFTDDAEAQFELGRPMHLVLAGWAVNGEITCGNHSDANLIIPENRIARNQTFEARDYFRLKIRGRKGHIEVLAPGEILVDEGEPAASYDDPEKHVFDVIRRDDSGEEDFAVRLRIVEDKRLPDPRARFVSLDHEDSLAAALVTRGLPKGTPRQITIDGIALTLYFDGEITRVSDYLASYRRGSAFHPFFVQHGDARFTTAPEDGAAFELHAGDRMVIGCSVYVLKTE